MVSLMNEIKLILATHLSYFRRHPWLLLLFIVGLSLGSALLTAIAGLNQEAKNRHQKTSALIDATVTHLVKPPIGQDYLDGKLWLTLRQQGFTNAQPVLRGRLKLASGKTLYLQGVDSLIWLTKPVGTSKNWTSENRARQDSSKPDRSKEASSKPAAGDSGFVFDTILPNPGAGEKTYWLRSPFAGMSRGSKCARQNSAIASVHMAPKPA
jgi:hypothetical protein